MRLRLGFASAVRVSHLHTAAVAAHQFLCESSCPPLRLATSSYSFIHLLSIHCTLLTKCSQGNHWWWCYISCNLFKIGKKYKHWWEKALVCNRAPSTSTLQTLFTPTGSYIQTNTFPFYSTSHNTLHFRLLKMANAESFGNTAGPVLVWKHFSVKGQKHSILETHTRQHLHADWVLSSLICHVPIMWPYSGRKQTTSASTTSRECSMDNESQVFLTVL